MARPPEVPAPTVGSVLPISVSVRTVVLEEVEGTFIWLRGARWLVDPPFVQLIDTTRNAHLALYSRKDDEERHGDDTYYDPSQYDWKVHYGPTAWSETDLATDASIGAAVPLQSSVTYVMVDPTTVEFSAIFDPTEQVTQAILRDVDTGESMYVVSWMGPSRARVGRLDERALLRHNAAVRAGASVGDYSITLPGGKLDMYRGPFIEPHEYVTKFIPGFFPDTNDVLHHITVVGAHAGIHPAFEQAVADDVPQDVTEYATHVALLQRRGPYARELGPLVSDEHILQAGRLGLNHSQLSTTPVGPYDATTILKSDVGAEARAATNAATALASTTTVHLPVPAVGADPLRFKDMTEDDLDKIAYLLSRASEDVVGAPDDAEVTAFLAAVEPGELARQRSLARRYLHKQVGDLAVYPIDRRAVSNEGAFTYDMIGRSGYFYVVNADANVVTITGVLSPYQVEFEFIDYANKDVSDTAWQGATLFLVPDATSSIRHYSLRAASASRYWRNFQSGDEVLPSGTVQFAPSDPLVDVVANTQLASGTRLPAPAFDNASLKRDLSNFTVLPESNRPTYLVLEKNSGSWVTNPLLNNLTSGAVRTIELLYGRSDASSTLDEMFDITPSHVENTFATRSPVWYEYFFTTETGLMFRGRCHASEAMAHAPNGTIAALALPIPDDYFPLITENVITYAVSLRVNSLYLEGHKSHLVHTLTQELDVRGRAHVVPYENDDDRTGIELTATDLATSSLSRANVYHGETRSTLSANAGAALCEVIHESDRCIITPSSMELYASSILTPSATTPSVGPYVIDREILEEIEEQYAEALDEINTLKQTLSSMFTILRLNVNASRGLSAEFARLAQFKYLYIGRGATIPTWEGLSFALNGMIGALTSENTSTLAAYIDDFATIVADGWQQFLYFYHEAWYMGLPLVLTESDITTLLGMTAWKSDAASGISEADLTEWVDYYYARVLGNTTDSPPWDGAFSIEMFQSARRFFRFYLKMLEHPTCETLREERMRTGSHPLPVSVARGNNPDVPIIHQVGTAPGTEAGTEVLVIEDMTKMLDVIEQTWEARYPMEMSTPSLLISSSTASAGIDEPPLLLPGGRLDLRVTNTLGVPPGERTGIFKQRSLGGRRGAVNALPYTYVNGSGLPTLGGEITSVSHLLEWIDASTATETCLPLFAFYDQGTFYRSLYVGETRGQAQSEYPYTLEQFAVWSSMEIPSSPTPTLWYTFTSGLRYKELPYAEIGYDYPISNQVAAETTRSPMYWGNIVFKFTAQPEAQEAYEALGSGQQYYFIYPRDGAFYVTLNVKGFSEYTRLARKAYFPNKRGITFRKAKNTTPLS